MKLPWLPIAKVTKPDEARSRFFSHVLPRGLALFFGGFALLNLLGNLRVARFDANLWWIDLRWLSSPLSNAFLALAGLSLLRFGVRPPRSPWGKRLVLVCGGLLAIVTLANGLHFFVLLARRTVSSSVPLPLSLLVAASMG